MRRAAAAIIGTIAGTTLLVGAKFGATTPQDAAARADLAPGTVLDSGAPAAGPQSPGATSTVPGKPSPGQPSPGASRATGAPAPTTPGATKTTTPAGSGPTTPAASGWKDGTYNGSAVQEKYGTITVTITVSGGKMTNLSAACGGCNSESQSISSNAFTKLRQEALTAQSASIATVSGATYTSGAYRTSLQAAINAAKA